MSAVSYAPRAVADLREISRYIAQGDPDRARSFVAGLRAKASRVAERPMAYPARDAIAPGIRTALYHRYLLFYRLINGGIRVERVLHGARDASSLFK